MVVAKEQVLEAPSIEVPHADLEADWIAVPAERPQQLHMHHADEPALVLIVGGQAAAAREASATARTVEAMPLV